MLPSRLAPPFKSWQAVHSVARWTGGDGRLFRYISGVSALAATRQATYISIQGRPVGYPFFLAVIKFFTGGYEHVGPVQIVMLGVSSAVWWLRSFYTRPQRWIIALVLEIGLLAYPAPFTSANLIIFRWLYRCVCT